MPLRILWYDLIRVIGAVAAGAGDQVVAVGASRPGSTAAHEFMSLFAAFVKKRCGSNLKMTQDQRVSWPAITKSRFLRFTAGAACVGAGSVAHLPQP